MENKLLSDAIGGLGHSLDAPIKDREYAWVERVGWALAFVEQTLLRLVSSSGDRNNHSDGHDYPKPIFGKLDRRLKKLRQESWSLAERCKELRRAVQNLAQPFTTPPELDLNPILEEGRKLLANLRQHFELEADLLLEDIAINRG
jgi:hypothetical protein